MEPADSVVCKTERSPGSDEKSKGKRIIYLYSVSEAAEALRCLTLTRKTEVVDGPTPKVSKASNANLAVKDASSEETYVSLPSASNMCCSACSLSFEHRNEMMDHFKSELHRFNLRRKLRGTAPVSEEMFEEMTGDISSISGSDSEESDSAIRGPDEKLDSSMSHAPESFADDDEFLSACKRQQKIFFRNNNGELVSIHRCLIFGKKGQLNSSEDVLRAVTNLPSVQKCAIFMVGGGHFAGALFDGEKVLQHKTFHRYVVRAKRGSVQSQCDKQGCAPRSAGASLRRYNEAALTQEIQDLINSWAAELKACSKIFLRAPGFNRAIFFGGKTPVFDKSDSRIHPISIRTRRPTFHELKRVHKALFTIEIFDCSVSESASSETSSEVPPVCANVPPLDDNRSAEHLPSRPKARSEAPVNERTELDKPEERSDASSGSEPDILSWVTNISDTSDLKEFDGTKRPRRKKKKDGKNAKKEKDEVVLSSELLEIRNQLFTACKVGEFSSFTTAMESLCNSFRSQISTTTEAENETSECPSITEEQSESSGLETNSLTNAPLNLDVDKRLSEFLSLKFGPQSTTLLHVATRAGNKQIIYELMTRGADPSIRDAQNQVPYLAATTKDTKNEFRRFMAQNPTRFDYVKAQVPGPLTEEMENERKSKANEKKKNQRKAKKEKQKEADLEEERKKAEEESRRAFLAMSDREKRAYAAEQRFKMQLERENSTKKVILSRCFECGSDMSGKVPFEYYNYKFCSTSCLKEHRLKTSTK